MVKRPSGGPQKKLRIQRVCHRWTNWTKIREGSCGRNKEGPRGRETREKQFRNTKEWQYASFALNQGLKKNKDVK